MADSPTALLQLALDDLEFCKPSVAEEGLHSISPAASALTTARSTKSGSTVKSQTSSKYGPGSSRMSSRSSSTFRSGGVYGRSSSSLREKLSGMKNSNSNDDNPLGAGLVMPGQTDYRATVPAPEQPAGITAAGLLEKGIVDGRVKFSTVWQQGQHRLDKVKHLLNRCHDVLDLPQDAQDLATLATLPPQFLDIEFRHMTSGLEELRPIRDKEDEDSAKTDGFIQVPTYITPKDPKPAETTTVSFVPKRTKNPVAEVRQYTKDKGRWGAIFELGDAGTVSVERRQRWSPSFTGLEEAEKTLTSLEAFSRRAVEADGSIDHPSKVTQGEKEDMLNEGLGQENDEISHFLAKWLEDINHRLGIILTYEQTKRNNKLHSMNHHGTQTTVASSRRSTIADGVPLLLNSSSRKKRASIAAANALLLLTPRTSGATSPSTSPVQAISPESLPGFDESDPYAMLEEDLHYSGLAISQRHRKHRGGGTGGSHFSAHNEGFRLAALRTVAAMKIQAVFRGSYTRAITGNSLKGRRTLFHAVDRRVARLWCERVVLPVSAPGGLNACRSSTPPWLLSICASLLSGKLASDYTHMPRPLSYVEYILQYLPEGFPAESVEVSGARLIATVHALQAQDPIFTLLYRLLLGDFTVWQEAVLSKLCHRLGELQTKTVNLSPKFLSLELDTENWMSPNSVRLLIKSMVKTTAEANVVTSRTWALARLLFITDSDQEESVATSNHSSSKKNNNRKVMTNVGGRIDLTLIPRDLYKPLESDAPELKLTMKQIMLILPMAMYDDYVPSRDLIRLILPPSAVSAYTSGGSAIAEKEVALQR